MTLEHALFALVSINAVLTFVSLYLTIRNRRNR